MFLCICNLHFFFVSNRKFENRLRYAYGKSLVRLNYMLTLSAHSLEFCYNRICIKYETNEKFQAIFENHISDWKAFFYKFYELKIYLWDLSRDIFRGGNTMETACWRLLCRVAHIMNKRHTYKKHIFANTEEIRLSWNDWNWIVALSSLKKRGKGLLFSYYACRVAS